MCPVWSFLNLIRFLDHIKVIDSVQKLDSVQSLIQPREGLPCSVYIDARHKQIFIYLLQCMVRSCLLPKLFSEAVWRKWFAGLASDLTSFLLIEDYITISLMTGTACIAGSCLNGEMGFNELWFLWLSWKLRSHRPNEQPQSEHRHRLCHWKG